ncbi:hypothetical protein QFZ96_002317 [Paraburkholderia youngii]
MHELRYKASTALSCLLFLLAACVPVTALANCEDHKTSEGWEECQKVLACGGLCDNHTVPCADGSWYIQYTISKKCPSDIRRRH